MLFRLGLAKLVLLFFCTTAHGKTNDINQKLSKLESSYLKAALEKGNFSLDKNPQNKIIKSIHIVTFSPFLPDDKLLSWTNYFHSNTKSFVIKNHLSIKENDIFSEPTIKQDEMVLRKNPLYSTAIVVPVKAPNNSNKYVDVLVVTKDNISIIFSANISSHANILSSLDFSMGEANLLGLNQSVYTTYSLNRTFHSLGATYANPTLFSSPWDIRLQSMGFFLKDSLKPDGFSIATSIQRKKNFSSNYYGFQVSGLASNKTIEEFKGRNINTVELPGSEKNWEKRYKELFIQTTTIVSKALFFNSTHSNRIFWGHGLAINRPKLLTTSFTMKEKVELEKKLLPRKKTESYLILGYRFHENSYLSLYDYKYYQLKETIALGFFGKITNNFGLKMLFSDRYFYNPILNLKYTLPFNQDSFITLSSVLATKFNGEWVNNSTQSSLEVVSPKIFQSFRILDHFTFSNTWNNEDNYNLSLGSSNGLRGVVPHFFRGKILLKNNFELRSSPLNLRYVLSGLSAFYDFGSAFDTFSSMNPAHILGVGLRLLSPALGKVTLSLDGGFAVYGPTKKSDLFVFSFGAGQTF